MIDANANAETLAEIVCNLHQSRYRPSGAKGFGQKKFGEAGEAGGIPAKVLLSFNSGLALARLEKAGKVSATYVVEASSSVTYAAPVGLQVTLRWSGYDVTCPELNSRRWNATVHVVPDPDAVFAFVAARNRDAAVQAANAREQEQAARAERNALAAAAARPCWDAPNAAWKVGSTEYRAFSFEKYGRLCQAVVSVGLAPTRSYFSEDRKWAAVLTYQEGEADSSFSSCSPCYGETREKALAEVLADIGKYLVVTPSAE